jgi:hypothetical protein
VMDEIEQILVTNHQRTWHAVVQRAGRARFRIFTGRGDVERAATLS